MKPELPTHPALPASRLHTFIDGAREFALYFLEGQRLIQDLALLHPVRRHGFAYFRDVVLSIQPTIALLKHGEQFGFYIDSEEPYFRLKIETSHQGATRSVLMPETFAEFPAAMRGKVRLLKLFPNKRVPYESVLEVDGLPLREIVNRVLRDSYQVNSVVMVSQRSDQSVMLHQLPPLAGKDEYEYSPEAVRARRDQIAESVRGIFDRALHDSGEIEASFAALGFRLLSAREIRFQCSCSRERMADNIVTACGVEYVRLFDPGQDTLEVTCEYCKSRYEVRREDLELAARPPN